MAGCKSRVELSATTTAFQRPSERARVRSQSRAQERLSPSLFRRYLYMYIASAEKIARVYARADAVNKERGPSSRERERERDEPRLRWCGERSICAGSV